MVDDSKMGSASREPRLTFRGSMPAIKYLPHVAIEGHRSSRTGSDDHPMRIATRRASGLDARGWTGELRGEVTQFFDDLAGEWHTRATPERLAVVTDALMRGLDPFQMPREVAVEIGSGIGIYSTLIA